MNHEDIAHKLRISNPAVMAWADQITSCAEDKLRYIGDVPEYSLLKTHLNSSKVLQTKAKNDSELYLPLVAILEILEQWVNASE